MSPLDLDRELRALAADPPFPPTPDLERAVRARLAERPPAAARRRGRLGRRHPGPPARRLLAAPLRWPLATQAAAALLLVFAALMAASPGVRSAVLEVLGIEGARIERREPSPRARAAGARLDLGQPTTLAAARARAPFDVVVPADPGRPDAVWFDRAAPGDGQVAFVWERAGTGDRPLLLTQIAALPEPVIGKAAGPGTDIEELVIGSEPGFWLTGDPHEFAFLSPDGQFRTDTLRLVGDALVWNRDGVLLRLEGAPSKARALQIARSVSER
jgi:hypothetical protein